MHTSPFLSGTVKTFDPAQGAGTISPADGSPEIAVSLSSIQVSSCSSFQAGIKQELMCGPWQTYHTVKALKPGQKIEYEVCPTIFSLIVSLSPPHM